MNDLKEIVYRANLELAASGLVMGTFGNLSAVDRKARVLVIKPSGIPYGQLTPDQMVTVSLDTGETTGTRLRPSSDTPTHLELYRAFDCSAIVHTHSEYATLFAQARMPVRCMGTTHADHFRGDIPVTRALTQAEVEEEYEKHTGLAIVETFRQSGTDPSAVSAVLVANHGPFTWGPDPGTAIEHARVLEYVARLDWRARILAPDAPRPDEWLVDKHYARKHGPRAYYGQK